MKTLTVVSLILAAGLAHAASNESCIERVKSACGRVPSDTYYAMKNADECKIVQQSGSNNVTFITSGGYKVIAANLDACRVSSYSFNSGRVTDSGVFQGRLIMTLSSQRVAFVGRNANIFELNNSKNKAYSDVNSVRIDGGSITLQRDNNQETSLTGEQVDNRVSDGKIELLSVPSESI